MAVFTKPTLRALLLPDGMGTRFILSAAIVGTVCLMWLLEIPVPDEGKLALGGVVGTYFAQRQNGGSHPTGGNGNGGE